jgi:DNA-binding YbaB/EbfC family protein
LKDMGAMMKQAQAMQARIAEAQDKIKGITLEGSAGGGLVRIGVTGSGHLTKVVIDPSLLVADGAEDLGDLILAAHADAKRQIDATQESLMREAMGPLAGLNIPGLKF